MPLDLIDLFNKQPKKQRRQPSFHLGFTGTQEGATDKQLTYFYKYVRDELNVDFFHHGDCRGADAQANHTIERINQYYRDKRTTIRNQIKIIIHPPTNPSKRAFCKPPVFDAQPYETRKPRPYLDRNHDIVNESQLLIAIPSTFAEELRSGTWATVRYAVKQGKPVLIIYPDGSTEKR